ncbi:hypothetical protein RclHR1_00700021 [Rhizophagus clarus]|uniref:Uncharacterized protein n=1 Tax=Rhizophagus clarus TaxID=94130 RepID=A0A2Z6SBR0_9GLOM|nr:hypothetical protein RclHR1_00700021 [Rhizophagus clarus]GES99828.1 hypothetical protein GLOIN_2v1545024 [Rhizophagus clarus]
MDSFSKLNIFISFLLLFALLMEVSSVAIDKQENFCDGFEFTLPKDTKQVKNNTHITVTWKKGKSQIETISDVELFTDKGLITILWNGQKSFDKSGTATEDVNIIAPSSLKLPTDIMLRSWGFTAKGPNCFKLTPKFILNP